MSGPIGIDDLGYDDRLYILAFDHRGSFEKMVGGDHDRIARREAPDLGGIPARGRGGSPEGVRGHPRRPAVRPRRRARGEGGRLPARDAGREDGPERVRLRVRRAVRREDRGVRPGLLEGARPLQPGRRRRAERAPDRQAAPAVRVAARAATEVPVRAARARRAGSARARRRQRRALRHRAAAGADDARRSCSCRTAASSPTSGRSRASTTARRAARSRSSAVARAATASRASCSGGAPPTRRSTSGCAPAPGLDGYIGFAIGRSIFVEAVKAYAADPDGFDRAAAVAKISANYRRFIEVYEGAPAPA